MKFSTTVEMPSHIPPVDYQDNILLMGSCFAERIGELLVGNNLSCNINPYGILYNPLSVSQALEEIIKGEEYREKDLFYYNGFYHSFMHHDVEFSSEVANNCLESINYSLNKAHLQLPQLNYLFITLGTAWGYIHKSTRKLVSNCHKVPANEFIRTRTSVEEIVYYYQDVIEQLALINPGIRILFTVSPIRHPKDGMHENQLSKSILLLAIDRLRKQFPDRVFYFPAYEIVMDELRDYRFYADDMLHPSNMAIEYIWERFSETIFTAETQMVIKEYQSIRKDLFHIPFYPDSQSHKRFLEQLLLKINRMQEKYPNFDLDKELKQCLAELKE